MNLPLLLPLLLALANLIPAMQQRQRHGVPQRQIQTTHQQRQQQNRATGIEQGQQSTDQNTAAKEQQHTQSRT